MARNKDKYENNNPRRQQIFMSPEEVASGKKTNWSALEITGKNLEFECFLLVENKTNYLIF